MKKIRTNPRMVKEPCQRRMVMAPRVQEENRAANSEKRESKEYSFGQHKIRIGLSINFNFDFSLMDKTVSVGENRGMSGTTNLR